MIYVVLFSNCYILIVSGVLFVFGGGYSGFLFRRGGGLYLLGFFLYGCFGILKNLHGSQTQNYAF